jgi:hypothetical protein
MISTNHFASAASRGGKTKMVRVSRPCFGENWFALRGTGRSNRFATWRLRGEIFDAQDKDGAFAAPARYINNKNHAHQKKLEEARQEKPAQDRAEETSGEALAARQLRA